MCPQTASGGCLRDRVEDRLAAEVLAGSSSDRSAPAGASARPAQRLGAAGQPLVGLVLGQVEAPVPGRRRDPRSEPEELDPVDLGRLAVEHGRRAPAAAGGAQRVLGLVVTGNEHRRSLDRSEGVDRLLEPVVLIGEVAGGDHDVVVGAALDQRSRPVEVAVQVAEGEELHRRQPPRDLARTSVSLAGRQLAPLAACRPRAPRSPAAGSSPARSSAGRSRARRSRPPRSPSRRGPGGRRGRSEQRRSARLGEPDLGTEEVDVVGFSAVLQLLARHDPVLLRWFDSCSGLTRSFHPEPINLRRSGSSRSSSSATAIV